MRGDERGVSQQTTTTTSFQKYCKNLPDFEFGVIEGVGCCFPSSTSQTVFKWRFKLSFLENFFSQNLHSKVILPLL